MIHGAGKEFGYLNYGEARKIEQDFIDRYFYVQFSIDRILFGLNPLGYHLHSFLWHLLSIFVFWLILSAKKEHLLSLIKILVATAVLAYHPFCAETIYWISARNDSMCLSFSLLSLYFLWREKPQWLWGGLCFLAALLSKETAIALLPAVLFLGIKHIKRLAIFFRGTFSRLDLYSKYSNR